ncbi:class I SAM-dependent methyltransferase [Devosia sp.]|uniref:class I SAM-dependent methyltransferase n=1 Tax=Devosia sp. TaxID=1871048 RepID=UPI002EFE1218
MAGFWDERYRTSEYVFGERPNAFLASQADLVRRHRRALAVADGEGRNGVWLAEQGLQVVSVDASPLGLAKARRLAARRGVAIETLEADLAAFDWPEASFDLVVAIFINFAGPPLRDAIFAGMQRALAPGGTLILEGYRPEQIAYGTGGPGNPEYLYTRQLLEDAFSRMHILQLVERDAEIREGSAHAGMSALIDLVARKPG